MADSSLAPSSIIPLPINLTQTQLLTNFYSPTFNRGAAIHVYSVQFTPEVEDDNRALRRELTASIAKQLKAKIGGYILSGLNLFAIKEESEAQNFACTGRGQTYTLSLKYSHQVPFTGRQAQRDTSMVLNVIMKKMLRELGLLQVTKLPKYYDPQGTVLLSNLNLEIWRGYTAELNFYESRPLVTIDFSSKIVHTRSLSDELQDIRAVGGDWVSQARCELVDRIIMAKYGNRSCYRIDDICMDKNPTCTFTKSGSEISYIDYFRKQYDITIKDPRQPLVLCKQKKKLCEFQVYLVPELMTLTGLDENMRKDFRMMSQIAEFTRLPPEKRCAVSSRLATNLNDNPKAQTVSSEFQFNISRMPITVESYNIGGESVYLSGNRVLPIGPDGNFQVRDNLLETVPMVSWVVFAGERDQREADEVARALHAKLVEMNVQMQGARVLPYDGHTFRSYLEAELSKNRIQIAVFLLNKRQHHRDYEKIKLITTNQYPVLTQVVLLPVNPKRFNSIIEKVALQVQAKIGAQLWAVRPSATFGKFLMVVGIDVFHDTVQRGKSVLGFCATIHPNLCKYYSTTILHNSGQEIATSIGQLFLSAIEVFKMKAKRYPETVIFFRDGVAESQTPAVRNFEVSSILRACEEVKAVTEPYAPRLIYTVVIKKTGAKFFTAPREGKRVEVSNPLPGTLVMNKVVPEVGDFYLVSHSANQGIASPTLYRVVFSSHKANFPLEELARLAYKLCHMYYNWSGAIKVPAPCMMAHKIAYLVGKFTHTPGSSALSTSPYYL